MTASPSATVAGAVQSMIEREVGAVLVVDEEHVIVGIFTQHDALRRVLYRGLDPDTTQLRDVMTANVISIASRASVRETLATMTRHRIRFVPIVEGRHVLGVVMVEDVALWLERENRELLEYMMGVQLDVGAATDSSMGRR